VAANAGQPFNQEGCVMTHELKTLGLIVIFILGGIARHFFHTWNRTRLGHLHEMDNLITDFILGGFGTLILFAFFADYMGWTS